MRSHDYHDDCGGLFASQDFDVLLWMRSVDFVPSLRLREKYLGMHSGGDGDDHHDDDELCTPGITSSYYDNRDCAPPASQGTVEM